MFIKTCCVMLMTLTIVSANAVCPEVKCTKDCVTGFREDINGCQTCNCVDPCEETKCQEGEVCQSIQVQCFAAPCYNEPQCVAAPKCPEIHCMLDCEYGYRVDENGCSRCSCVNPCDTVKCQTNEVCKVYKKKCADPSCTWYIRCDEQPCINEAKCVSACRQIYCFIPCLHGYAKNALGCQDACNCLDPCEHRRCKAGQVCKAENVKCEKEPCYPKAQCVDAKECPPLDCKACRSGHLRDENGCPTCECYDRCEGIECPEGQVCEEVELKCVKAPCYNMRRCVPATK